MKIRSIVGPVPLFVSWRLGPLRRTNVTHFLPDPRLANGSPWLGVWFTVDVTGENYCGKTARKIAVGAYERRRST